MRFHSTTSFGQSLGARSRSRSKKLGCGAQLKYVYHQSERHGYLYNLLPTVLGNIKNSLTGSTQSHRPVERRMEAKEAAALSSIFSHLESVWRKTTAGKV